MNDRGHRTPNGEAPAGGSPRAQGRRTGNGTRPRAFLGDTTGGMACGVCGVTLQLLIGHRVVRVSCGQGRNVLHARCVAEALARGTAPAPLCCPAVNCGARHPRRDALEAAVQAGPGLRDRTVRMGGGGIGSEDIRSRGLWYGWDQTSLGTGMPLDAVSLEDLGQRFATGEKVQLQLAEAHARLSVHVLGILNHVMGEHRPNRDSATPNSLLRAIKLWYIMPALLHSLDGRITRRQRFALVEREDIVFLLLWLMAYTRRGDLRQRDAAQEASEEAKLGRASSACRHAGGVKVAARNLLAEPRSAGNGETWNTFDGQVPLRRPLRGVRGAGGCSASERNQVRRWKRPPAAPWR